MVADGIARRALAKRGRTFMHPKVVVDSIDHELVSVLEEARTLWQQFRGLMFRPPLWRGDGLLLRGCGAIHTFGVRESIDAVFVDRSFRVVKVVRKIRPWTGVAFGGRRASAVIEVPAGGADLVQPGMQLRIQDSFSSAF
jgi:uncharacterized membrane protein (UPF0127 family)